MHERTNHGQKITQQAAVLGLLKSCGKLFREANLATAIGTDGEISPVGRRQVYVRNWGGNSNSNSAALQTTRFLIAQKEKKERVVGYPHTSMEDGYLNGLSPKEAKARSRKIDRELRQAKRKLDSEVKLLLLGAGESGKSTIAKQMKILHLSGFSQEERQSWKRIVHTNAISSMTSLILGAQKVLLIFLEDKQGKSSSPLI